MSSLYLTTDRKTGQLSLTAPKLSQWL